MYKFKYKQFFTIVWLLVLATTMQTFAQSFTVTGTVSDDDGALPGANVIIKGAARGTISGDDGRYSIEVPDQDAVLVFSFTGYHSQEVTVGSQRIIDVTLVSGQQISELVVVGYGSLRRETVVGAVSTVRSDELQRSSATTASGALAGRIPGLNSRMNDGRAGASTAIQIRNFGTPLFVIDGIISDEGQFNNLDFNDIESITVMKDASAAIYGMQAANGVIVITTNRGRRNERTTINVNSYYGVSKMFRFPRPGSVEDYTRGLMQSETLNRAYINPGEPNHRWDADELRKWREGTEEGYRGFDWGDYILTSQPQWYVNANARGGSENVNFYFSVSHINQRENLRNFGGFERTNVQINVDATILERLTFGASFNGRIESRERPGVPGGDDVWETIFAMYRNQPIRRPFINDDPRYPQATGPDAAKNVAMYTYDIMGRWRNDWRVGQLNFNVDFEIFDGLKLRGLLGYYLAHNWFDNQEYRWHLYEVHPETGNIVIGHRMDNPWREREIQMREDLTTQLQLTYDKQFGNHNINATAVWETRRRDRPRNYVRDRPTSDNLSLMYFPTLVEFTDEGIRTQARTGVAGRLNYNYDHKYLIELSGRYDGSFMFPPGYRFGFFPSAAVGWRISKENFWQDSTVGGIVSDLMLRVSYGVLGSDDFGNANDRYREHDDVPGYTFNEGGSVIDGAWTLGTRSRGVPTTTVSWIEAELFNAGFDVQFFGGKLHGEASYFRRKTTGLAARRNDVQIPSEMGFALPWENLNSNVHTGFDAALRWSDRIGDIRYSVGGNITFARQIDWDRYNPIRGNSWDHYRNNINQRYAYLNWGYKTNGQFQSWEQIANHPIDNDGQGNRTQIPGDIIFVDVNGDGVINGQDERPLYYRQDGATPYMNFALIVSAQWKGFDLGLDFTGAAFAGIQQDHESRTPFHGGGNNPQWYFDNSWRLEDPYDANSRMIPGKYPFMIEGRGGHVQYSRRSDFWYHTVNYLKLRNLEVGYTVPQNIIGRAGMSKFRIYYRGQNLFSIDNVSHLNIDPEIHEGTFLRIPTSRVHLFGFGLTF